MGKKYVMVVDERGCMNADGDNNFSIIGVVFEKNYCMQLNNRRCELDKRINGYKEKMLKISNSEIRLEDIMFGENVFSNYNNANIKKLIEDLPALFQSLKFTIIVSTIKQNYSDLKTSYNMAVSNLLKNFFSFIVKRNGECGGIIMRERKEIESKNLQQEFFSVYSKRSDNLGIENIEEIINSFVICNEESRYKMALIAGGILNNIICRVSNGLREMNNDLIANVSYGYKDKIFNAIKSKIYKDQAISLYGDKLQKISYSGAEMLIKEVKVLESEVINKNLIIDKKEKEISELNEEIKILHKQIENIMFNRRREQAVLDIFSDVEDSIKVGLRDFKVM